MSSQQGPPPYGQQPPSKYTVVTKKRGLSGISHGTHLLLTVCTCGLWAMVWFAWWLFRVIVPKRQKTTYRAR
jgi:hypothetical protein